MKKHTSKLIALVLALCLCLSLSVSAFAAEIDSSRWPCRRTAT